MFRVLSLALVACLLMAGSAFADMKIGVFNSQAVAMDSDAAKAAQQKLQSQFGAEKTQLEKQAKDLQSKGEALQAQVAKMSAKEREDKQMEFLRLRRACGRRYFFAGSILSALQNVFRHRSGEKLGPLRRDGNSASQHRERKLADFPSED